MGDAVASGSVGMPVRRVRGVRWVLTALAVALCAASLTACGTAPAPVRAADGGAVPLPQGVRTVPPGPAGGVSVSGCDASLAPSGPLPQPGAMPAGSAMERIERRGYLIAGVDQDSYLFGYRNSSSDPHASPLVGFDIDFVREIAQAIFGAPDRVRYRIVTQAGRIPALQDGSVDLVVDMMTVDCERAKQIAFSSDYVDAGQRFLVDESSTVRGIGDLAGRKVCSATGTTSIQKLADPSYHIVPVAAVNWADCLVMLQQRQVDAISTTDLLLLGLQAQDPYTRIVGPQITFERHGIGMPMGEDDLVRFVNAVLERLRTDGTWAAIYTRWIGTRLGPVPPPPPAVYQ
ncbi:glutamate ABC transporter substrate-binding protein [Streptacidiphilus sp. EB129]|uniref:glutamate ABC transporter substrate-binding protein n=1 Tax=Streptacidiphilus sp. EB129 TaxID=3156262 RepID=UPI003515E75B